MPTTVSCISTKGRSRPHPWWRTFLLVSPKSRDGWHWTGWSWIPTKPNSSGWEHGRSLPRWTQVQLLLVYPHWDANQPSITLESPSTASWHWRTMFVALACLLLQLRQLRVMRRSLSSDHSDACASLVHAFISSRLDYCNSLLAGISDTLIWQLQSVLRVAARLGSTIRSPKSSATSFTGCLLDSESTSNWEFWSTSVSTMRLLLIWWRWCYPCTSHIPSGICFVHLLTEVLLCQGQRVFSWVLEVSRVLGPHSTTVFQLTWKLQIKLSMYLINCLKHICFEKLTTLLSTIKSIYVYSGLRCTAPP